MSFMYSVVARIGDSQGFADASNSWAGDRIREFGAIDFTASNVIMGGEMAGMTIIGFEFPNADSAMEANAKIYADDDMVSMMRDTQVQVVRRGLFKVQAEVGTRTGNVGTILYVAGRAPDDATAASNLELNWRHMESGANGIVSLLSIANGPAPFTGTAVTFADSLDDLLAASQSMFADADVQAAMQNSGLSVVGRVMTRRLV